MSEYHYELMDFSVFEHWLDIRCDNGILVMVLKLTF